MTSKDAVDAVLDELKRRKGFDYWWDPIDDEVKEEIKDSLTDRIEDAYKDK